MSKSFIPFIRLFHIVVAPPATLEELHKVAKIYDLLGIAGNYWGKFYRLMSDD